MAIDFVQLLLVLGAAWGAGLLASRVGFPAILGELSVGIILGPALLGVFAPNDALSVLAEVGVYLLMLYIGMEIEPRQLVRASSAGLLAAVGGFIVPFAAGLALMIGSGYSTTAGLFMGMAMGVTSLATKSRILVDLQLVGTRIASVMMVGALFADTLALVLFAGIISFASSGTVDLLSVAVTIGKALLFFGAAGFIGLRVFPWLGARLHRIGADERTANFTLIVLVALCFGELAHLAGLHGILGAFLAGVFLQEGILQRKWSHDIAGVVHDLSIGFLAPIFFVSAGFHVSLDVVTTHTALLLGVIVLATVGKILGTMLFYLPSGYGWREGLAVGTGMNGRGAVEIIIAEIALAMGVITQDIFSILVLMAFVTTLTVPLLLGWSVRWLRRRGELALDDSDRVRTIILGATPFGLALAEALSERGPVALIERNKLRIRLARQRGFEVVEGDALAHVALYAAGAEQAHTLIVAFSDVPAGLVAARYAHNRFGVPRCVVPSVSHAPDALSPDLESGYIDQMILTDEVVAELTSAGGDDEYTLRTAVLPDADVDPEEWLQAFGPDSAPIAVGDGEQRRPLVRGDLPRAGETVVLVVRRGQRHHGRRSAWTWLRQAPIVELDGATTDDCLAGLAGELARLAGRDEGTVLELLRRREQEEPTTIAPGVAVPHITLEQLGAPRIVLGRSQPVPADRAEFGPVRLWIAIASDPDRRDEYLWALWAVARLAGDRGFIDEWAESNRETLPAVLAAAIERATGEGAVS
ncbi:MAG: sodium:proton exchanger [Candidatus Dadabacteria bacterium]|nr:MAG: sodium:proton exchanger [Candidatus Dadabacteria bacterium]